MNNKLHIKIDWNNHDTINYRTDFYIYLETEEEIITKKEIIERGIGLDIVKNIIKCYDIKIIDINDYDDLINKTNEESYMNIICRLILALNLDCMSNNSYIYLTYDDELTLSKYSNKEFIFEF